MILNQSIAAKQKQFNFSNGWSSDQILSDILLTGVVPSQGALNCISQVTSDIVAAILKRLLYPYSRYRQQQSDSYHLVFKYLHFHLRNCKAYYFNSFVLNNLMQSRKVILIIDDDPDFQTILQSIFSKIGFKVRSIFTGQVTDTLRTPPFPDIILLDMDLPVANGVEIGKQLKSNAIK